MTHEELAGPYLEAIRRAFDFASQTGSGCRPVHFLVGVADGEGPVAAALRPPDGRTLRAVVAAMGRVADGAPAGYLHIQAQQGARSLATGRGEPTGVEHLLLALLDQGSPEVLDALSRAALDWAAIRHAALAALGAADDVPPIAFAPMTPAGTLDRPALPVTDLSPRARDLLGWRLEHLPIGMLHRRSDTEALIHLERTMAWRVADRLALGDDQRYSLLHYHAEAVAERVAQARPDLASGLARPRGRADHRPQALPLALRHPWRRYRWLRVTVGWGAWVRNRQAAARNRWFKLRTARAYHGAPQP